MEDAAPRGKGAVTNTLTGKITLCTNTYNVSFQKKLERRRNSIKILVN